MCWLTFDCDSVSKGAYSDCHKHVPIEQSATNEQTIALLQGFTRLTVVRFAGKT